MDDAQCPCVCRFCQVYELGVYVVNGTWLAVMVLVAIAYYPEMKAYFSGRLRSEEPSHGPVHIRSAETMSIIPAAGSELQTVTSKTIQQPAKPEPQQAQIQTQTMAQKAPISKVPTPTPTQATLIDIPPPSADPVKKHAADKFLLPKLSAAIPPIVPTKPSTPSTANNGRGLKHESTGSGYFNTMMDGKKPVASISQYLQKQAKDQRHKEGGLKESKQRDDKQRSEKKKVKKVKRAPVRSDERERKKGRERKKDREK